MSSGLGELTIDGGHKRDYTAKLMVKVDFSQNESVFGSVTTSLKHSFRVPIDLPLSPENQSRIIEQIVDSFNNHVFEAREPMRNTVGNQDFPRRVHA